MKFLELHPRIMEFMKILISHMRITKNHANFRIPNENHENHEKSRIPRENHENHEIMEFRKIIMKIMKIKKIQMRITKIMKNQRIPLEKQSKS